MATRIVSAAPDLSDLSFIDSTGLRTLLKAHRSAAHGGWTIDIVATSTVVRRALSLTGLEHLASPGPELRHPGSRWFDEWSVRR